jgi:hypothetical protein
MKAKKWYFFAEFTNGTTRQYATQVCKSPGRTNNYKFLLEVLEFDNVKSVGYSLKK